MGVETGIIGRRDASRLRLNLPARLDLVGGMRRCVLADVSRTGARIVLRKPPKPGELGVLIVQSLEAFGTVVWSSREGCGFLFDDPIEESDLLLLRSAHDHADDLAKEQSIEFARKWVEGG